MSCSGIYIEREREKERERERERERARERKRKKERFREILIFFFFVFQNHFLSKQTLLLITKTILFFIFINQVGFFLLFLEVVVNHMLIPMVCFFIYVSIYLLWIDDNKFSFFFFFFFFFLIINNNNNNNINNT